MISDWNDLSEAILFPKGTRWSVELQRYASPYVFRGLPSADFDLSPSLMRFRGSLTKNGKIPIEKQLLKLFQKYASSSVTLELSAWNWLALAQHHGLPTRLLDWTFSPFVALHFVTNVNLFDDKPGVVWCVDAFAAREHVPSPLRDVLEEEGTTTFTAEMLDRAAPSLQHLEALSDKDFLLFFEPPSIDARIVNQYALFSLMPRPAIRLDEWLKERPTLARRIIIPPHLKIEIRDKLDQINITERMLFPGLDGLSAWLKRHCGHGSIV